MSRIGAGHYSLFADDHTLYYIYFHFERRLKLRLAWSATNCSLETYIFGIVDVFGLCI